MFRLAPLHCTIGRAQGSPWSALGLGFVGLLLQFNNQSCHWLHHRLGENHPEILWPDNCLAVLRILTWIQLAQ